MRLDVFGVVIQVAGRSLTPGVLLVFESELVLRESSFGRLVPPANMGGP